MKKTIYNLYLILSLFFAICGVCSTADAQPFGAGKYGANVPYGGQTALSIATSGGLSIPVTPLSSGTLATGTSNVTVTSTDVTGYKLYIRSSTTTDMTNYTAILPTSANGTLASLALNTWGYNTDSSSNFVGSSLTDTLITSVTGPASSGSITTVKYGIYVDFGKPAGKYSTDIVYTAVPQTN